MMSTTVERLRCRNCGRIIALMVTSPFRIRCRDCKVETKG